MAQARVKEFKYMKALNVIRNYTKKHIRGSLKGERKEYFRLNSKRGLWNLLGLIITFNMI